MFITRLVFDMFSAQLELMKEEVVFWSPSVHSLFGAQGRDATDEIVSVSQKELTLEHPLSHRDVHVLERLLLFVLAFSSL